MAEQIQDTVQQVISRKVGKGTAYTLKLANAGFIGAGFDSPVCNEGDVVSLQWANNDKGYKQMIKGTLQVVQSGGPAPQPTPAAPAGGNQPAPTSGGGQTKNGYWEEKEKRDVGTQKAIQYQASRNAAIEVAKIAIENDCISLGAKKADKADILLAFIDEVTDRYNKDVTDVMQTGSRSQEYDDNKQDNSAEEVGDFA